MSTTKLRCFVRGDDSNGGFTVKIPSDDDVSILKELIKQERPHRFAHIAAKDIQLFSDSIPDNDNLEATVNAIKFNERQELPSWKEISEVFQAPEKGHIHVIAVIPLVAEVGGFASVFTLNCVVSGDGVDKIFDVKIAPNETVSTLKELIRAELPMYAGIPAKDIQLFKVSLPVDDDPDGKLDALEIEQQEELNPPNTKISEFFRDSTGDQPTLHVVVREPATLDLKRRREEEEEPPELKKRAKAERDAAEAPPPSSLAKTAVAFLSEQGKRPIYNGRPITLEGPPIVIYEHAFAAIQEQLDNIASISVEEDTIHTVTALVSLAAEIYTTEGDRMAHTLPILERLLDVKLQPPVNVDHAGRKIAESNAMATCQLSNSSHSAIYLHSEWKLELGIGGEGSIQCPPTLTKQLCTPKYKTMRDASKCPCILVTMAGSYISFSGFIFSDIYVVQPFTDYIALSGTPSGTLARIRHISKYFSIFKKGLVMLRSAYKQMDIVGSNNGISVARLLPHPSYKNDSRPPESLEFLRQYAKADGQHYYHIYEAKYGDKHALVKFCETYSVDAHRLLADNGLAPELYYSSELRGGITIVVMANICGATTAYHTFKRRGLPTAVMTEVRKAIEILHQNDIVYGDLRRQNVLVEEVHGNSSMPWRVWLCDFDWASKAGEGRYPLRLNMEQIYWAKGVKPNGIMEKAHDLEMLEMLPNTF
ncbi:hypothetical protein FA15DRAFT_665955 [Coprinopsis marcescibilis]|uniref:Crinkler effector protein N-terminal domain-containing protein n=1 Tax=Coprinopsis marcescibilis TaxID=230819 RepID=A0A5C3L4J5_COPMA|nr:hypothetical protein FA15DRAFT_665955 [Coprinopsis marcescibilis]